MSRDDAPTGWVRTTLGEVATPSRPRVRPQDFSQLPFVGMEHVERDTMRLLGTAPASAVRSSAVHFQPGDVLYGRLRPYLNKVYIPSFEGLCSAEFLVFPSRDHLHSHYLGYFLNSAPFVAFASHLNTGDRPRVDFDQLRGCPFPLAPRPDQDRIVAEIEKHFTRLDAAEAALKRVQANLKRYRASVLKAAVEGRLVSTEAQRARRDGRSFETADCVLARLKARREGLSEPAFPDGTCHELPEGWCWASVDAAGDVLLGRQRAPQYLTGRSFHPYLRVANVKDDALDLSDVEQMDFDGPHLAKYRLEPGDILVSEGQSPELVGQSAIYRGGIEGLCFQKTLHRFRPIPEGPTAEYAQIVFRASVKTGVFRKVASITTNIAHLTLEKFKASPFPLPPLAEQTWIIIEVERLMSIADAVEASLRATARRGSTLRHAILTLAFAGRLFAKPRTFTMSQV